ncbi:beta-galactosidase [Actinoplanes sp. CA-252034]|uniref:beta-galactosidase n=1 Tax=Actinoplanes sp. CA-252034 TaxID=3239906 RepID=UPI003D973063
MPHLYLVSDEAAAAFRDYVAAGGTLVVTYLSGIAEPDSRIRLGGYPGAFREILGVRVIEWHPQVPGTVITLSAAPASDGAPDAAGLVAGRWIERVETAGAETVSLYADGPLAGSPAITRNRYGAGSAWYISTGLTDDSLQALLHRVAEESGIGPVLPGLPSEVEAVRRGDLLFLFNHGDRAATVGDVVLPPGGVRIRSADGVEGPPVGRG